MSQKRHAFLSIEDKHGFRRTIDLEEREFVVGRRSQNDISFPSESTVSRVHAKIFFENDHFVLADEQSTFGTYVNNKKISSISLKNGDEIRFGKCFHIRIIFYEESKIYSFSSENFELMKKILQISKALNSSLVLEQVLQMVLDGVMEVTTADRGFLMLREDDGLFHTKMTKNIRKDNLTGSVMKVSESVVEEVEKSGKSLIIRDIQDYSWLQTKDSIVSLELRSIMCVPLKVIHFAQAVADETIIFSSTDSQGVSFTSDEIIGIVYVDSRVSNKSFTYMDLEILEALCSHAAISIYNSRLIRDLEKSEKFSSTLVDASRLLNSTLDLNELLRIIIDLAGNMLDSEKSSLFLLDKEVNMLHAFMFDGSKTTEKTISSEAGVVAQVVRDGEIKNLRDPERISELAEKTEVINDDYLLSLLCVPLRDKENKIIGALETLNKKEGFYDIDDEKMLEALSIHASLAIENAMLHKELTEKRKLDQELEVAAEIQKRLLPAHPPEIPHFDVDALTVQCKQVGGDYYDFVKLDEDKFGIAVADIAGKGIPAALMMSNLQANLQSRAIYDHNPANVVCAINNLIYINSMSNKYATHCYGIINSRERTFVYTNAGHNPPLLRRNNGQWEELTIGGMVVGLFDNQEYEQAEIIMEPGDILIIFTDGVSEAMNQIGEEFGEDRLKETLVKNKELTAPKICDAIYNEIMAFEEGTERHDDLTLLVIKALD